MSSFSIMVQPLKCLETSFLSLPTKTGFSSLTPMPPLPFLHSINNTESLSFILRNSINTTYTREPVVHVIQANFYNLPVFIDTEKSS